MPDAYRYVRLARGVAEWLRDQCGKQEIDEITMSIETPVVHKTNVLAYRKQVSTVLAIEMMLALEGVDWFIEINPTWAKLAATNDGRATKTEIVSASPFRGSGPSVEAMADAWAIALAGKLRLDTRVSMRGITSGEYYSPAAEETL